MLTSFFPEWDGAAVVVERSPKRDIIVETFMMKY
jgi:hypothetical protein